jgi:hypothetical protein
LKWIERRSTPVGLSIGQ